MIYERLPQSIQHITLNFEQGVTTTLIQPTTPTSILGTCWRIHHEAKDIVRNSVEKWVLQSDIKVIITLRSVSIAAVQYTLELVDLLVS